MAPRPTWQYIAVSAVLFYVTYCFLLGLPLLSSNLPKYTGLHGVGTVDIEIPVQQRLISDAIVKSTDKPAFKVCIVVTDHDTG